jgi:hypothetical protein
MLNIEEIENGCQQAGLPHHHHFLLKIFENFLGMKFDV